MRENVPTNRPWVDALAYSRAVRVDNVIVVSATSAVTDDGTVVAPGDPYTQAKHALGTVIAAIEQAGGRAEDVVRTGIFLTNVGDWVEVGRAHQEVFADIRPACSIMTVVSLVAPEVVVEVEAMAVVQRDAS